MIFDLHSHTTYSDGALAPDVLFERATEQHVDVLSITDHDTVDAYLGIPPIPASLQLVPGIEFSTQWENIGIHVLGLNIEPGSGAIAEGTRYQSNARLNRARQIAENLAKKGIVDSLPGAQKLSAGSYIGRPHFARYLVDIGKVDSVGTAFRKYLGDGKAGDVKQHWAELRQIVEWIRDSKGIPVLAHPLKYKLTRSKLKRLLDAFRMAGGQGMEVVSGQQTPRQTADMAQLCKEKNLFASCGSDFHMPGKHWGELGVFAALPDDVIPVWDRF